MITSPLLACSNSCLIQQHSSNDELLSSGDVSCTISSGATKPRQDKRCSRFPSQYPSPILVGNRTSFWTGTHRTFPSSHNFRVEIELNVNSSLDINTLLPNRCRNKLLTNPLLAWIWSFQLLLRQQQVKMTKLSVGCRVMASIAGWSLFEPSYRLNDTTPPDVSDKLNVRGLEAADGTVRLPGSLQNNDCESRNEVKMLVCFLRTPKQKPHLRAGLISWSCSISMLSRPGSTESTRSPPRRIITGSWTWKGTAGRKKAAATPKSAKRMTAIVFIESFGSISE